MSSPPHITLLTLLLSPLILLAACAETTAPQPPMDSSKQPTHPFTNRLSKEKSPYLLQHQHNPVDWYPWGSEAFEKARTENKPIFLSIGYSTCHWCHVMERESFENQPIADYLNTHFVSIKLDREERPDIDKIYMTFVQAMSGSGGWPLNVFLTPDLKPFYGGTYFPPEPKFGRPSFLQILQQINEFWTTRRDEIDASAKDIHQQLTRIMQSPPPPPTEVTWENLQDALKNFKKAYDPTYGGFSSAPKFPRPTLPSFILTAAHHFQDTEALEMVDFTCRKMAQGGINDQLGGGFARYSVDSKWLVPHFEKMLYDNAQLVHLYLDTYLLTASPEHAQTSHQILEYVLRDMTHPQGGFYSAEDADSEGKEGKFYCWTEAELQEILPGETFQVVKKYYGITSTGNFLDHSDPNALTGQNVLSIVNPNLTPEETTLLKSARQTLLNQRNKRVRPHLDDKILVSWNGMMLSAMARASAVLKHPPYLQAAEKNFQFLQQTFWDASAQQLFHRWRDGERDQVQLLEGYAQFLAGTLELYQVTLNPSYLHFARDLADSMIHHFYDSEQGGFWQSHLSATHLILRIKEDHDGAEPSGNSVATLALLQLAAITDHAKYRTIAEKTLSLYSNQAKTNPQSIPNFLRAFAFLLEEPKRIVIVSPDNLNPPPTTLLQAVHGVYQPHKVVLSNQGPVEPFAKSLPIPKDTPIAYICTGTECLPPTSDPNAVMKSMAAQQK